MASVLRDRLLPPVLLGMLLAVLVLLVVVPLSLVVYGAFLTELPFGSRSASLTLANFASLSQPEVLIAALNSVLLAIGGTALATVIGCFLAWLAARTDVPGKSFIHLTGVLPLFISSLVAAVTWSLLGAGNAGYLNIILSDLGLDLRINMRSLWGFIFVDGLYHVPYPFLFVYGALTLITSDMEEAAAVHGANPLRATRRIVFPLVKPAILASIIINAVLMIENVAIPQILGAPVGLETLSIRIYHLMIGTPNSPNQASALALVLASVVCVLIYAQQRVLKGRDFRTITGKGVRQKLVPLGPWRYVAFAAVVLYFACAVLLPVLALLFGSFRANQFVPNSAAFIDFSQMSPDRLLEVIGSREVQSGLINSVLVATSTAIFGTFLFFVLAYVANRTTVPGRRLLEYVVMVPLAIPALLIAMGTLWTWVRLPVPVYGTLLIIIIAFIPRFMPQGYRAIASSLGQIHDDLEHAAMVSGAGRWQVARRIIFPLIRGGIAATAFMLFVLALRELGAALFLYTTYTRVLSIVVLESYDSGSWDFVASVSLLYTLLLGAFTLAGRKWLRPDL